MADLTNVWILLVGPLVVVRCWQMFTHMAGG